jgi:hypothetical protein
VARVARLEVETPAAVLAARPSGDESAETEEDAHGEAEKCRDCSHSVRLLPSSRRLAGREKELGRPLLNRDVGKCEQAD